MLGLDPCEECKKAVKDGLKPVQDCGKCKTTRLSADNQYVWSLIELVTPGLFNGTGGFNYGAIEFVFNRYGVTGTAIERECFEFILEYGVVAIEVAEHKAKVYGD